VQYVLSNNHVIARLNQAGRGEDITQPGLVDNGCQPNPNDVVADLADFVPIRFATGRRAPPNEVDAAIAQVRPGTVDPNGAILDIGPVSASIVRDSLGMPVQKSGRTTGHTLGTIAAVDVTLDVCYDPACSQVARYMDQFLVTPGTFGFFGDSGSLVTNVVAPRAAPNPVGLLFAVSPLYTAANPIGAVLSAFRAGMVGSGATASAVEPVERTSPGRETKRRHEAALLDQPGVVGVGIGPDGVIEVYLADESEAHRRQIPAQLEAVPVRVIVSGAFHAR
jgi:hypothetical protein